METNYKQAAQWGTASLSVTCPGLRVGADRVQGVGLMGV